MGINPAIPVDHAKQPATRGDPAPAGGATRRASPAWRRSSGSQPLVPDTAMRYGLYDARGYDYPIERRYDTLWRRAVAPPRGFTPPTLLVRAGRRVAPRARPARRDRRHPAAGRAARAGLGGQLRRRRRAAVREPARRAARVGGRRASARSPARTPRSTRSSIPRFDARGGPRSSSGRSRGSGTTRPRAARRGSCATSPTGSSSRRRADRRALVVLSDVHFPGWQATVDGREVPIERVDYLLRGVPGRRRDAPDRAHLPARELADRLDRERARRPRVCSSRCGRVGGHGRGARPHAEPPARRRRPGGAERRGAARAEGGRPLARHLSRARRARAALPRGVGPARPDAVRAAGLLPERRGRRAGRDPAPDRGRGRRLRRVRHPGRQRGHDRVPGAGAGLAGRLPGGRRDGVRGARAPLLGEPARAHRCTPPSSPTTSSRCSSRPACPTSRTSCRSTSTATTTGSGGPSSATGRAWW